MSPKEWLMISFAINGGSFALGDRCHGANRAKSPDRALTARGSRGTTPMRSAVVLPQAFTPRTFTVEQYRFLSLPL